MSVKADRQKKGRNLDGTILARDNSHAHLSHLFYGYGSIATDAGGTP